MNITAYSLFKGVPPQVTPQKTQFLKKSPDFLGCTIKKSEYTKLQSLSKLSFLFSFFPKNVLYGSYTAKFKKM